MTETIRTAMDRLMTTAVEPQDYVAEDGLLYCGSCNTPKEAFFPNGRKLFGRDRHPAECLCRQEAREKQEEEERTRLHHEKVRRLKLQGFTDWAMQNWTFENDHGQNPQMQLARRYVNHWPEMREKNVGLLLWGGVGTGKSYTAGCIANALMEQEVAVCMTNFARIMNELNSTFAGRNEVVDKLCSYPLLVIDDFGMERGTEYALEQIYNIIDSRYRSRKPLIVTTNLTLTELKNPQDTAHARIYDRLLELCTPIACTGPSMRKNIGQAKLNLLKTLLASLYFYCKFCHVSISEKDLWNGINQELHQRLEEHKNLKKLMQKNSGKSKLQSKEIAIKREIEQLSGNIIRLESQKRSSYEQYVLGKISKEKFLELKQDLENEIVEPKREKATKEKERTVVQEELQQKKQIAGNTEILLAADNLQQYVKKIEVDRMKITYTEFLL